MFGTYCWPRVQFPGLKDSFQAPITPSPRFSYPTFLYISYCAGLGAFSKQRCSETPPISRPLQN